MAASRGYKEIVKALLSTPAVQPNMPVARGWTALHVACWKGFTPVVDELVRHGKKPLLLWGVNCLKTDLINGVSPEVAVTDIY